MRPVLALLFTCASLAVLSALAFLLPAPAGVGAAPHDVFAPMLTSVGTPSSGYGVLGAVVAVLVVGSLCAGTLVGMSRATERDRVVTIALFGVYAGILVLMMVSQAGWDAGSRTWFIGLPTPTAWLVYGVMLFPWVIVFWLLSGFSRWYFTDEDESRFRGIVDRHDPAEDHPV